MKKNCSPFPYRSKIDTRLLMLLLILISCVSTETVNAQGDSQDLADRKLSGTANFDLGRHIGGAVSLGKLTVTSDDLGMDPARSITVAENGFAFLANDILIRNGSGESLVFDSSNQSHDFDVFYFGKGEYAENVTLPGSNSYSNGSQETVTVFGGNWFTQAEYTRLNGQRQTFSINDERFRVPDIQRRLSPLTLELSNNPSEISEAYNRTNSAGRILTTLPLKKELDGNFRWSLAENQTPIRERRNTLFSVEASSEGEPAPVLDLSGINISAQGTSLRNRNLLAEEVELGRFVLGRAPSSLQGTNTVSVTTFGNDDERSRLTLGSFEKSQDGVTAKLDNDTLFNTHNSSANVELTANFSIDPTETGTFRKTIDVSSSITGEGIAGETVQSNLRVGYEYAIVENNSAVANDTTIFKFEGEDVAGRTAQNRSARAEFSRFGHTDIFVSQSANLENTTLQTVNLSNGNGIFGEGLVGESVTANVSYDIHQKTVQGSDLEITESGLIDDKIVFKNKQTVDTSKLQAQAILRQVNEAGSSRWTLDGLIGWDEDLAAGETLTLNPIFDDTGIDSSSDTLGRNYRKSISFKFQDGVRDLESNIVQGTEIGFVAEGRRNADRDFNIIGGSSRTQTATYLLERKDVVVGSSGSAIVAAGTSLGGEGINLTNTTGNTSTQVGTATEFQILDSEILNSQAGVEVEFVNLDNIDSNAAYAGSDTSGFFSDIVEVNGLGGIFHVLEVSYDESLGASDLQWYSEELGRWVNAVLGNSNVAPGIELEEGSSINGYATIDGEIVYIPDYLEEMRFDGGYDEYLISLDGGPAQLGAFGSGGGRAWAVVDHNSPFGAVGSPIAVPEPNTLVLFGLFAGGLLVRRVRRELTVTTTC